MTLVPLKQLEFLSTNIPDDTTPQWDIEAGYATDTTRQLNNKLYQALGTIYPLCEYIYDNTDPLRPHYTVTAIDGMQVVDATAVPCVQYETIVYVVDNDTYYQYDKADATVDFTVEDLAAPANFTIITGYRHDIYHPETTPLKWKDLGYVNKYKILDSSLSSQTEVSGDMTMSFLASKVDQVYFFNVYANSITVIVTELANNTEIFNETKQLYFKNGGTWFSYFFNDFIVKTKEYFSGFISFDVRIDITIEAINGTSKCGLVGIGRSEWIGGTLYGARIGMQDFSKKETNGSGETYIEKGNYKATNSLTIDVPIGLTDQVTNRLTELRATPIIFSGTDDFDSTKIFGIYNDFEAVISTPTITKLSLELESLI